MTNERKTVAGLATGTARSHKTTETIHLTADKETLCFHTGKKKVPLNLAWEVKSTFSILIHCLSYGPHEIAHRACFFVVFLFFSSSLNNVFVRLMLSLPRDKLISSLYTLHLPSSSPSKTLTGVSPDLPLLCNLGTPTVMDTLLRGS